MKNKKPEDYNKILQVLSMEAILVATIFFSNVIMKFLIFISNGNIEEVMNEIKAANFMFRFAITYVLFTFLLNLRKRVIDKANTEKIKNKLIKEQAIKTQNINLLGLIALSVLGVCTQVILQDTATVYNKIALVAQVIVLITAAIIAQKKLNFPK